MSQADTMAAATNITTALVQAAAPEDVGQLAKAQFAVHHHSDEQGVHGGHHGRFGQRGTRRTRRAHQNDHGQAQGLHRFAQC